MTMSSSKLHYTRDNMLQHLYPQILKSFILKRLAPSRTTRNHEIWRQLPSILYSGSEHSLLTDAKRLNKGGVTVKLSLSSMSCLSIHLQCTETRGVESLGPPLIILRPSCSSSFIIGRIYTGHSLISSGGTRPRGQQVAHPAWAFSVSERRI